MARGIKLPSKAVNGRFALLDGDEYIAQLIRVGLGSADSENPFQPQEDLDSLIFGINDDTTSSTAGVVIQRLFQSLEQDQLARLRDISFETIDGELNAIIEYVNLESGARQQLSVPINGGQF